MNDHLPIDVDSAGLDTLLSRELDPLFWPPQRLGLASAWWAHVPFAFWLTAACRPRLLVELGTHNGVSYAAFCEAVLHARLATRCYAVDTWVGDEHSGHYGEEVYNDLRDFHDRRYLAFSSLLRSTFDDAVHYFENGSIDLLHIDGHHTYQAVKHDYQTWRLKLSDRAIVIFHDTNVRERDFGVCQFFSELSKQFPSFEFSHGYGLGVVAVGTAASAAVKRLCAVTRDQDVAAVCERFSHIGERWFATARETLGMAGAGRHIAEIEAHMRASQTALEARIAAADAQLAETNARAETLSRARQEAAERDTALTEALSSARQEIERVRGETAALDEALSRARQEAAERDTELVSLRADLANHVLEVQGLRDVVAGSRAEAAAQRTAFVEARQAAADRDTTIEGLHREISSLNDVVAERETAMERMRSELASLGDALASTQQIGATIDQLFNNLRFVFKRKAITLADRARDAGEWAAAARHYRKALDRNPNRPEIWVQYGHVLKEAYRLSAAEQAYRQAIAGAPTLADPYRYLGDVLSAQRKREAAIIAYLQAQSLDPASPHALSGLKGLGWSEKDLVGLKDISD